MTAEPVFNHEWKLARAVEHFKALEKEVRSWATGDPYSIAGERKHDGETVLSEVFSTDWLEAGISGEMSAGQRPGGACRCIESGALQSRIGSA